MSQLLTSISKLTMNSGKDSAVGDAFVAQPKSDLKSKLGTIIGIIELFGQPDEFVDKFFEIINDLETEYYLPPFENEGGIEKRFEECLQRANRRINKAINESIIEIELKNINSLVGLINHDKIYLSQIGQNNALLFHQKSRFDYLIVDIFSQAGDKTAKINPEKMFSNIVNGSINEKDNLFFCNDSVLEYISQNELMEIVTSDSPTSALKEIEDLLQKESKDNDFYAIDIKPVFKASEKPDEPLKAVETNLNNQIPEKHSIPSQTSINKLISTQENTERYLAPSVAPSWKKALMILIWGIKISINFIIKYLKIGLNKLSKIIKRFYKYLKIKIIEFINSKRKSSNSVSKNSEINIDTEKVEPTTDNISNVKGVENFNYHKKNRTISVMISDWLNNQLAKFVSLNKLQQILFITALVLVFFFSQSMVWQGRIVNTTEKTTTADIIKQIEDNLNAGDAKNIFNDEAGAKLSLQAAIELMEQIPNSRKYQETKDKLQIRIDELNQSLQRIAYIDNPNVVSDLSNQNPSAEISAISKSGNYIFAYDNQNQNIYKIDLDKKQTTAKQLASNFNNVRKIQAIDENNIIILNSDSELYNFNFETNSAENNLTSNDKITDLSIYGGKLYTLKSDKGQIFKHFPVETGFNSGSSWIKDGTDIKNSVAMTIDSGIYVIYDNGDIKYFLNGNLNTTNFSTSTPAISSPKQIFSDGESNYLYILDQNNERLIVFEKNSGNLKIQYSSKEFTDMKSMIIESKEKKIYLLADKKIYLIETNN